MNQLVKEYKNRLTAISFLFIMAGISAGFIGLDILKAVTLIAATVIAGVPIAIKAFHSLRLRIFSIEVLVTIAVIGALFIHEYIESSVVTFLFLFGDYLEARTLAKTRSSLKDLVESAPQEATVIRGGVKVTIPVEEVIVGDHVIVHSGGKIPVDGTISSGDGAINEATITGESIPVMKKISSPVYSGTVVDNGYIELVAEKVGDDTTFAKIIELVEEAQESKTKTEKFLTNFAQFYTPAVVLIAIIVYFMTKNFHTAITFLVIACPGALVIGAPVSNVAGIGSAAKHGVLLKGGEVMETFSKVNTIVFDKTGTLTKGQPAITSIDLFQPMEEYELLTIVAQAEQRSEHHLGQTIVKEAKRRNLPLQHKLEEGEIIKGYGLRANVEGKTLFIGNRKLMEANHIMLTDHMSEIATMREMLGNTAIYIAINGKIAAIISIADEIREDAQAAINTMRKIGIKRFIMLTGDNKHTAKLVSATLGIEEYYAQLLPHEKLEYINKFKQDGHIVAMAGDGINDAPAIAAAHIGVAMGKGGTDISMETADVVLMADKLEQLAHAYLISKATIRNMKQNTFFAVAIVIILLIGVLNGNVHLASGMFIHEASVLLVILNAMRLLKRKKQPKA
ncbi:heavy metal translocating P-type ATPase [Metabacillus malikii]|uniref:Cd(2+)-exporting ATPase n=1 Tax=Metabacillus malikii TaxID=1504265 RepID=A0ABT9ZQH4_9BACI|nr:cation-translocating P-type ATPase [Metabacillus malikii]MDQ0233480.1 Cd2+/Zn2+-exporting ATPase [Metabacillus malikii]